MNRILRLLRMEHKEIGMNAHLHKHRSITKNKTITQIVIGKTKFSHFTNTRKTVVRGDTILQMIITMIAYSLTIGGILLVLGLQTESLIIQDRKIQHSDYLLHRAANPSQLVWSRKSTKHEYYSSNSTSTLGFCLWNSRAIKSRAA